ncbi:MAG: CoA transferase [Dehalococcoidales bacterium]|nr:CoA transferase [Dehalococcoidales bacterium]
MSGGALAGIRVVELATMVAGPYCGKLLADLGADVIKVESPEGDPSREFGPFPTGGPHPERSAMFLYLNTSKRGITLNPDVVEGLEALKRLVKWADILIDSFPPERLEGLGLDRETLTQLNPALIYTSITPYGRTGPRAGVKGDELTLIHAGGLGNLLPTRSVDVDRAPVKMGGYAVGYHGGITAALATMAAVLSQRKTGRGRFIDISLQEVILAMVRTGLAGDRYQDSTWSRVPDRPPAMGRMKTRDGYIVAGTPEDHHFRAFRELMGNPEWLAGKQWETLAYRAHHMMEVTDKIDEWVLQQSKDELHHRGARMGIAMGPLNSAEDLMKDEQYTARDYFVEVEHPEAGRHRYAGWPYRMTATSPRVQRPAPLLGEHNGEIYDSLLEYSPGEYELLQRAGAV